MKRQMRYMLTHDLNGSVQRSKEKRVQERPKKVQLFHTCLINEVYPEVGMSVVRVLERLGIEVEVPLEQTCCGSRLTTPDSRRTREQRRATRSPCFSARRAL